MELHRALGTKVIGLICISLNLYATIAPPSGFVSCWACVPRGTCVARKKAQFVAEAWFFL